MKRIFIIFLVFTLVFSFISCGGNNKGTSTGNDSAASVSAPESGSSGGTEGKAAAYFNIFASGTYHMKAKMVGGGMEATMETYAKGGNVATLTDVAGQSTRMILKDNTMYIVNDAEKTVMTIPSMPGGGMEESVKTEGMVLVGSGTASFNGKNLPYEEYSDNQGNKSQYFFDGNTFAGIRTVTSEGTMDMIILVLDQNVPNNVFDIPSNYQQFGGF